MASIETADLTKNYGDLCAVDGLNLEVKDEIFGLCTDEFRKLTV